MLLGIDTTAAQCAVALVAGDRVARRIERVRRGHDTLLFSLIDEALAEIGAGYPDIARIVCCTGPGSFVGVRMGVAAARGLALGTGVPAVGVSRFEVLAVEAAEVCAGGGPVGVVLAGRGETAFFQRFGQDGMALDAPQIVSAETPAPGLLEAVELLAGDGAPAWNHRPRCLPEGLPDPVLLARLGAGRSADFPPAPLYLRPAAADLPREAPPRLLD